MISDEQRICASVLMGVMAGAAAIYLGYLNLITFRRVVRARSFRVGIALISISIVLGIVFLAMLIGYIEPDREAVPIIEQLGIALVVGITALSGLAVFCFGVGLLGRVLGSRKQKGERQKGSGL